MYKRQELHGTARQLEDWAITTPYAEVIDTTLHGGRLRIQDDTNPEVAADLLRNMITSGLKVSEFKREEQNLESSFIEILAESNAQ